MWTQAFVVQHVIMAILWTLTAIAAYLTGKELLEEIRKEATTNDMGRVRRARLGARQDS
jgi:hypothetical protein